MLYSENQGENDWIMSEKTRMLNKKKSIEILAPAGSYTCFRAALCAGADAVYAGGPRFGARAYAHNFTEEELVKAIEESHFHGRKFYLTVNTLLKENEIDCLFDYLDPLYRCGLDAVIVQDPGVFRYIRESFPEMDIHASTQMTITSAAGAKLLEEQGASRVVPARELSLKEVRRIHDETSLEVECFVHGALCYCYSGQCLMSSMIGGRSGNRGQCAQPCRLLWSAQGHKGHLLSLKDICTLDMIPELIEAGIDSFKIEGRMKAPEYVALVTAMYRKYTDLYLLKGREGFHVDPADREKLMDLYNRGGSGTGYYRQHNGKDMISLGRPNHAGVPAFRVLSQKGREVRAAALTEVNRGDVIEIGEGRENYTLGGNIKKGEELKFLAPKGRQFKKGTELCRIRNEKLICDVKNCYVDAKLPVKADAILYLSEENPAVLTVSTGEHTFTVQSEENVQHAQKQPLEEAGVRARLLKTGNTEFVFENTEIYMDESVFLPMQQLNSLRRMALEGLRREIVSSFYRSAGIRNNLPEEQRKQNNKKLIIIAETREQFEAAADHVRKEDAGEPSVSRICPDCQMASDFFRDSEIRTLADSLRKRGVEVVPVMPYILRDNAEKVFESMAHDMFEFPLDGMMIRNYESFSFLKKHKFDKRIILDHNLYVFNRHAKQFWRDLGVEEFTVPAELSADEMETMGMNGCALTVYGRFPVMVTAQCIRKTVSECTGRKGILYLTDRKDKKYPVRNYCDFCYNVIYSMSVLYLGGQTDRIRRLSPDGLILRFSVEDREETIKLLRLAADAFTATRGGEADMHPYESGGAYADRKNTDCLIPESTTGHFTRGII